MIEQAPMLRTVRAIAGEFGLAPTTLQSRLRRAALPSPVALLKAVRAIRVAQLFALPGGAPVETVACVAGFASARSLGRHMRVYFGITASEFRARKSVAVLSDALVGVIQRDAARWATFDPLVDVADEVGRRRRLLQQRLDELERMAAMVRHQLQVAS